MAIKMRNNTDEHAICCDCGEEQSKVLNMFDLCIGGYVFTICDECNEKLLSKVLKAECLKSGRLKSNHDMAIIRRRNTRFTKQISESKNVEHMTINEALKDVKQLGDME